MATSRLSVVVRRGFSFYAHSPRFRQVPRKHQILNLCPCSFHSSSVLSGQSSPAYVIYRNGLPVFTVPLPSRHETCEFTLKPVTHTVGDLLKFLKEEDGGIDRAVIHNNDGVRISQSTTIDILLRSDFKLSINDDLYEFTSQQVSQDVQVQTSEHVQEFADVKAVIADLYSRLHIDQHLVKEEDGLLKQLHELKMELEPLEQIKEDLERKGHIYTRRLKWTGLGLMGIQFGVLARLTWWEYSWDIMEPVTYFITYGTIIAMYGYFVLTQQEYNFETARDRQFLLSFHKNSKKQKLDIQRYNALKEAIYNLEYDIKRIQDPLRRQVPMRDIKKE